MSEPGVLQLRLVVTVDDHEEAVRFYRDVLGMPELEAYSSGADGRLVILDAGRATLELASPTYAEYIDSVEVGRRVAGHIRVAFEVPDSGRQTELLVQAGATLIAPPTLTPWGSSNARLDAPGGLQLTLFTEGVD